jgi:oxygen-dependent protoporphyrinogen oxidase
MIGSWDTSQSQVHVVGAGIAGLLVAYRLDQQGYEVSLYESQETPGGLIRTEQTPWGIAEWALHSCLGSSSVMEFFKELGVDWIQATHAQRYFLRQGRWRRFPLGKLETIGACARACWVQGKARDGDVRTWAEAYLGKTACQYLVAPMVQGIYGVPPEDIAQEAAFPQWTVAPGKTLLRNWLRKKWTRSPSPILAPRQGMQALVEALASRLKQRLQKRYLMGREVRSLASLRGNLVLAIPAQAASALLWKEDPRLAQTLEQVKYASLISVTAFVQRKDFASGIGILIPEGEKIQALGVFFNSSAFAERVSDAQYSSFTLFFGGVRSPDLFQASDEVLASVVKKDLSLLLGSLEVLHLVICRHAQAIPYYNASLLQMWKVAQEGWCSRPGHLLFGNYTGQVSLRGMIESVFQKKEEGCKHEKRRS